MKTSRLPAIPVLVLFLALAVSAGPQDAQSRFVDINIDALFEGPLIANPVFMELTGVKVLRREDDSTMVLAVAVTDIRDDTGKDKLRRMKVCRSKALASLMQQNEEIQVWTYSKSTDQTVIVIEDGVEHGKNLSEILDITRTKAEGFVKDMPVVGTWKSRDRKLFYQALGKIFKPDDLTVH